MISSKSHVTLVTILVLFKRSYVVVIHSCTTVIPQTDFLYFMTISSKSHVILVTILVLFKRSYVVVPHSCTTVIPQIHFLYFLITNEKNIFRTTEAIPVTERRYKRLCYIFSIKEEID